MKTNIVHFNGNLKLVQIMTDGNDLWDKYAIRSFMQLTIYEWHLNQNTAVQASDVTQKPILLLRTMFNCAEQTLSYLVFHSRSPQSTRAILLRVMSSIQSISRMFINQGRICLKYSDTAMCTGSSKNIPNDQ